MNLNGHALRDKAGMAAMKTLGVERSKDKELFVISETGKGHAAGCFLDGIMTATGVRWLSRSLTNRPGRHSESHSNLIFSRMP